MRRFYILAISCVIAATPMLVLGSPAAATELPRKHLKPFSSEAQLKSYLQKVRRKGFGIGSGNGVASMGVAETVTVAGSAARAEESITNVQHAGVDEGGIVKTFRNFLVILRRGRLFTVDVSDGTRKTVSYVNAFGPDLDPDGAWYDEMLISKNNIVVIGYSYERDGTEIGLFRINDDGTIRYRSTYHLRSNDYYSSRNYSSRLIGDRLIFYTPLGLDLNDPQSSLPAVRKWRRAAKESDFRRTVSAGRIYRADKDVDENDLTLHTVTDCDLSRGEMSCSAMSVLGPSGRVFYVSPNSVYIWAANSSWDEPEERNRSILFRMPLDGSYPTALRVSGSPVDQFSFHEEGSSLNVLVRSESDGDGMWSAEAAEGEVALLRIPTALLGDGSTFAPSSSYLKLETPSGYGFQNRFIGDHVLYGSYEEGGDEGPREKRLYLANWRTGAPSSLPLSHGVGRLDVLGSGAIAVGPKGDDLVFTSVALGNSPRVVDSYTMENAAESESRSHGYFYKAETDTEGVVGLPVISGSGGDSEPTASASIVFLRNRSLRFGELGRLASGSAKAAEDECKASCVDWYGDARPIFLRGRVFALLGYELVEGTLSSGGIREIGRLDFGPLRESANSAPKK
jgi:hypothetical protein